MKIGAKKDNKRHSNTQVKKNGNKKNLVIIGIVAITILLIMWVYAMGKKAEETVSVAMWSGDVYKNQAITDTDLVEYKMLKAEFEKYATENSNGEKKRRIVLWSEKDKLLNTFAAYPLKKNTVVMITDIVKSRIDNSDAVLYSFPGKNIVSLKLGENDLETFKTYLQPGDRVNITAIYKDEAQDSESNENQESTRQEQIFTDIMIADILNDSGASVLDMYTQYNQATVYEQAQMDSDENWQEKTKPVTLLVALTPEEESSYYNYLAKSDAEFHMSLPQRTK